jgi:GxxExxY protein
MQYFLASDFLIMNQTLPTPTDSHLFKQEGYDLIAAAFEVHRHNGGGMAEEVYQECLEMELRMRQIPFQPKVEIAIFYKGLELKKRYIPDLEVSGGMVVELKAVTALNSEHEAQLLNYMRLAKAKVGYLINFGPLRGVEFKRYVL